MNAEHWIDLRCHPSTPAGAVRAIAVLVRRSAAGAELRISYRLDGELARISIPLPAVPRINTELWRRTCFEAFIAVDGQSAYHELNFSPSGQWAVYAFSGYRNGAPLLDETMRPRIEVRTGGARLELDAAVRLDALRAGYPRAVLRVGLSAVIETRDGLSYWALHHRAGKPDFHDARGFALLLEPPAPRW
jgi:hypothetical protein